MLYLEIHQRLLAKSSNGLPTGFKEAATILESPPILNLRMESTKAKNHNSVLVVVNDMFRPTPVSDVLRSVLDEIQRAGV